MPALSKSLLALSLLLTIYTAQAQKPDKEKLGYINYLQPPMSKELDSGSYYFLSIETEDNDAYRRKLLEQEFQVSPFRQADTHNEPDFTVEIIEGIFSYDNPQRKSFQEKYKAGGVDKSRTIYYYEGDVRYHYTLKVVKDDQEIFREDISGSEKISSQKSESMSLAHDYYVQHKTRVKQEMVARRASELAGVFNNRFNTVEKTLHLNAIKIKEKKFEYPLFNQAFDKLERAFNILKASTEATEECTALLQEAAATWQDFVKDATPNEEKSRKDAGVTAAAYYNLGIASFLLQRYHDASQAFTQAASYDNKVMYDVDYLIQISKDLSQRTTFALAELAD
ncbi:MAG TPA: hypothetical protein DCG19_12810 [Cryomorphaceae bacterium]|nr:hypothetical protein [Owenweeksia sp.]HAD98283.1 hypothetical protein [Cryomorphaceae bacterium]|tara:strand:+ start:187 stop:1200 length:1014 start_codon:yes stop_codon:yes gene_type:complete